MNLRKKATDLLKTDVEKEEAEVVALYSRIYELKAQIKEIETDARDRATDLYEGEGLAVITGDEGVVTVKVVKGSKRIDTKLVRKILTKEQIEEVTSVGADSMRFSFTAKSGS